MMDGKSIKIMEIPPWRISWHCVSNRQVRRQIRLRAWCASFCAPLPGALLEAWSAAKSPALLNNLKHCHQTITELIVHSCIPLSKINMHELVIFLLILFLIYLIDFIITTPLIYIINIIIIIIFLNFLDFAYYLLH